MLTRLSRTRGPWSWLMVLAIALGTFGLASGLVGPTASVVRADDAEGGDTTDDGATDDTGGEGGDATTEEGDSDPEKKSFLGWLIEASGIFGAILLVLSFVMVALIMMNVLAVRRENMLPADFIEGFEQRLAAKDYQGAYDAAKNDDSFVARVLAAGLSKLNRGYEEAIEGMQEVGEEENMTLEHRLSYLALIGSVAPMVGLMGTVYGMILSFQQIASSDTSPKPSELAAGISTALFTTLEGLAVAIPAMVFYSILRNRVAKFVLEVGMVSEGLMARFSTVGKKAGGAGAATAPAQKAE